MSNMTSHTWENEVNRYLNYNATGSAHTPYSTCNNAIHLFQITINQGTGIHNKGVILGFRPAPDTGSTETTITPFPTSNATLALPERLTRLENILGFNISDLSRILQVERRSIYNWKAGLISSLQHRTEERLSQIESIADRWCALCSKPLAWARNEQLANLDAIPLLEALSASEPKIDLIEAALPDLAHRMDSLAKASRRKQNAAVSRALHEVKLPTSDDMAAKLNARARQFQSDQDTDN